MEFVDYCSFRLGCKNTADVSAFTLCSALLAILCVSDLCGVDAQ